MKENWKVFVVDAFAKEMFGGNQAGVVLLSENENFPEDILMRKIAGELKHSETAFVKRASGDSFCIRYFTPVEEVELCGHATIGSFWVLLSEGMIEPGSYRLFAGKERTGLEVLVGENGIWMDMASPKVYYTFTPEEAVKLYRAYGLKEEAGPMLPKIVNTGLSDILLPVSSREALQEAVQNCELVEEISRRYQVVGVHMFCLSKQTDILAECRNFAPLYGIPEESATGTSNGALTWYLYEQGLVREGQENVFVQGEAMGKPSVIRSRLECGWKVKIGGTAVISLRGEMPRMYG